MELFQLEAFGDKHIILGRSGVRNKKSNTYEEFVDKFKHKKTTDDCYTPPTVYNAILEWVRKKCDIEGKNIVRPFYPGGDYENYPYMPDDVVVDNPPFSILSKICRFYLDRHIPYFLFGPHLTLFSSKLSHTVIVVGSRGNIKYENGAIVATGFLSNMFGDVAAMTAPDLAEDIRKAQDEAKSSPLPKYVYPDNVVSVSLLEKIVNGNAEILIRNDECVKISKLDSQTAYKKACFGSALLVSDRKSEEARRKSEEARRKSEEARRKAIVWKLSEREKEIISKLK